MAKKNYLVIDVSLCFDCNNCFVACKDEHVMNCWLPYTDEQPRHGHRWVNILRQERGQYPRIDVNSLPQPCQHCADAPCMKAFPDLVYKREDGIVMIDAEKAKGTKALVSSCPYGAIWYNDEKDVPQKCTMCAHILDGHGESVLSQPRCAHSCPTGATKFYQEEPADFQKRIEAEGLQRFLPEISSDGGVWYKNLYRWTTHFIAGGLLKDGDCAKGVKVELKGTDTPAQTTNYFGDFLFDGLAPGDYTIVADGKEIKSVTIASSVNIGNIDL
ncbi:MAG: (4Fe-4S)-binding protein [Oscillospiraceae bacterium]|nr:(4Fe-4S)-binding protein [Oscillospiraceae bacterium]